MKSREKILMAALLAVLVIWQGHAFVTGMIFGPFDTRNNRIKTLEESIASKQLQAREMVQAGKKWKEWKEQSLPPDATVASSLYQNWVLELAGQAGLSDVSVTAGKGGSGKGGGRETVYSSVSATVKGQGTQEQICTFMDRFAQAGLLQKISRLEVKSTKHEGSPTMELTVTVEGAALKEAESRTTMFPKDKSPAKDPPSFKTKAEYAELAGKNLFVRGLKGPVRPSLPDTADQVFLVASLTEKGEKEAWLYDQSSKKETILKEKGSFDVARVKGTVTEIGRDYVILKIDAKGDCRLELGQNLKQLQVLSDTAAGTQPPQTSPASPATPAS